MATLAKIPPLLSVFRDQPRVPSQVQDSTLQNAQAVNAAFKQTNTALAPVQAATAAGTIASGVLVLAIMSGTGTYNLVTHNLGRVASGFLVVGKSETCDVFQDPADPGCPGTNGTTSASRVGPGPTLNNRTPTNTIRLQCTAGSPTEVALWIF